MRFILFLLFVFPLASVSHSSDEFISSKRFSNETYKQALKRVKAHLPSNKIKSLLMRDTPVGKKVPFYLMDFSLVPEVTTYDELLTMFQLIRDKRFLSYDSVPEFNRRISWLFPDDGCFARAALARMLLDEEHLTQPAKIFAFGDLNVETPYSSNGSVSWWYHVAGVVSYMGSVYVLDPAVNSNAPMLVDDWYNKMGNAGELSGIVCNAFSYNPFDNCYKLTTSSDEEALSAQAHYLEREWERVVELGFNPMELLGNNPPWIINVSKNKEV